MFVLNGRNLPLDVPFEHDGIQYPATWLRLVSPEERAAIGIEERSDVEQFYDQRFYWGVAEDGSFIEKDLEGLKEQWIAQVKQTANSLLSQTDWAVTRANDPSSGKTISNSVLEERGRIRSKSDQKEVAITSATSVNDLAAYLTSTEFANWDDQQNIEAGEGNAVINGVTSGGFVTGDALFGSEGEDTLVLG